MNLLVVFCFYFVYGRFVGGIFNITSVEKTYGNVIPCIQLKSNFSNNKNYKINNFLFPKDAIEHYNNILQLTEQFRNLPMHHYAGYSGPWIENLFISNFRNSTLETFNGFIPLFIQWIDIQISGDSNFKKVLDVLSKVLRENVLYLAISQGDNGLDIIGDTFPNILVLSAGGYGHVPIPLIKSEIVWQEFPDKFEQDLGFFIF
jgi:hypothetical protein